MSTTNPGSKPGVTLYSWLRQTRTTNNDKRQNAEDMDIDSDDSDDSDADDSDADEDDDKYHSSPEQPNLKDKGKKAVTRSGKHDFTFQNTLNSLRARNAISNATKHTPPRDTDEGPPNLAISAQGTVQHTTASLAGTKRKGNDLVASTSAPPKAIAPPVTASAASTPEVPIQSTDDTPPRDPMAPPPPTKRAKKLPARRKAVSPFNRSAQHLRDVGMIGHTARVQDTGTSELLYALATLQDELLLQQGVSQLSKTLRDTAKEITDNLVQKMAVLTKDTVTAVRQGVIKAGRELDKCTDVVKVAAGDLMATAEGATTSYARAAATGDSPKPTLSTLLQPTTQARMERDRRRILIDPPKGQARLYPTTVGNISVAKTATEALLKAGGKTTWAFISCTKLEKGGVLLEANVADVKDWLADSENLTTFLTTFSPGAAVKAKKYTIKALYLPVEQPIDTAEAWRIIEKENDLPPFAISLIKWMKPAARRGKNQQQGLQTLENNFRCHKSKTEPLRCLNCQNYGHIASRCTILKAICATCAQHHVNTGDCPQLNRKEAHFCVSCQTAGHPSWERTCPSRLKLQRDLDERLESNLLPFFPTEEPWTQRRSPFYSGRGISQDLSDCDWRQAKKDRLQQTRIPDVFRPMVTASLQHNTKGRGESSSVKPSKPDPARSPATNEAIAMTTTKEKSPMSVAS
ncbi:CCHC-type domain-containing protein [Pleurotus pulmonarius]